MAGGGQIETEHRPCPPPGGSKVIGREHDWENRWRENSFETVTPRSFPLPHLQFLRVKLE
jgi:hypothetical protein